MLNCSSKHFNWYFRLVISLATSAISIAASVIALPLTGLAAAMGVYSVESNGSVYAYCSTVYNDAISICNFTYFIICLKFDIVNNSYLL